MQLEATAPGATTGADGSGADRSGAIGWMIRHSAQLALGAFVVYLVVAFFLLLFHYGDGTWFQGDDWGFIDGRSLRSASDLLRPQNGHWSTVPIVAFQVLYRIVGLRTYAPYMGTTIVLHLTLAALLRVVMRRAGVGPWVATIVAGTFVLFGVGYENIFLAIQISMVSSMVFGLVQLLLTDHDGPVDWRDGVGLLAGLLAIMASSIGLPMVLAVGVSVLIRRGWRPALLSTAPLAAVYGIWLVWVRSTGGSVATSELGMRDARLVLSWVASATTGVFASLGQHGLIAIGLGVLLVGGCALAWTSLDRATFRRVANAPIALLVGGLVLVVMVATQRARLGETTGQDLARSSRYMAMATALTLPSLAVAAAAVIGRWRIAAPVVLGLFLVGVPANIAALDTDGTLINRQFLAAQREFVTAVADSPLAEEVPGDVHPNPNELLTANLTVGFLLAAREDGKLPDPVEVSPVLEDRVAVRLSLSQDAADDPIPPSSCRTFIEPALIQPHQGDRFVLQTTVNIALEDAPGHFTAPVTYSTAWSGATLTTQVADATFRITPVAPATSFMWCTVP